MKSNNVKSGKRFVKKMVQTFLYLFLTKVTLWVISFLYRLYCLFVGLQFNTVCQLRMCGLALLSQHKNKQCCICVACVTIYVWYMRVQSHWNTNHSCIQMLMRWNQMPAHIRLESLPSVTLWPYSTIHLKFLIAGCDSSYTKCMWEILWRSLRLVDFLDSSDSKWKQTAVPVHNRLTTRKLCQTA